jgi:hypothetical protein
MIKFTGIDDMTNGMIPEITGYTDNPPKLPSQYAKPARAQNIGGGIR